MLVVVGVALVFDALSFALVGVPADDEVLVEPAFAFTVDEIPAVETCVPEVVALPVEVPEAWVVVAPVAPAAAVFPGASEGAAMARVGWTRAPVPQGVGSPFG